MEAEPLSSPDILSIDLPQQPPPDLNFPKPDFTEIVQDHPDTPRSDKSEAPVIKPTFKNLLQAKKRLQAFSSARTGSLPSSPKKNKLSTPQEEKNDEATTPIKKMPKKGAYDKARAVIEEIEEMKREEMEILELQRQACKRSRSRSRTPDKGRFKKVDKKSRNYRRKSISPKKTRESPKKHKEPPKKTKRYPRNWREFYEFDANFDVNRTFEVPLPTGNNELLKQGCFESPSLPIVPFKMKTVNREDKVVPFQFVRYTRAKPVIPYSVNFCAIKETHVTKKMILDTLPKVIVGHMEALYSNSVKYPLEESDSKVKKSRSWHPKNWKNESESKMKIFEKSVGLSFLQTYTGEEEENDQVEMEEEVKDEKNDVKEDKTGVDKNVNEVAKKKKKKVKKDESDPSTVDKKKKKKHKEKKKHADENPAEKTTKKKKRNSREKAKKKEKRTKDKKHKRKKAKEKKKKDKPQPEQKPVERLTKEQVIEELKEIEEKLAKKREEEKEKKEKEEKTRKRKHSEHDTDSKKPKQEKNKKTSEENHSEHPLKKKLEKAKKPDKVEKHEEEIKPEVKKPRHSEEVVVRKRKSRWSEGVQVKEEIPDFDEMELIAEITKDENEKDSKESTPDTEEYHSHWESDDDVSSSVPRNSLKLNRSWESDEELFERRPNRDQKPSESYTNLEIPLNIKTFSRRSEPLSVIRELKLLEEERRSLSEERKKLEVEKQKIIKLKEEAKVEKQIEEMRPRTPEEVVKIKKEKCEINDFSIDSLNNSLLSAVSSTESNFPIAVLENEYEEFIKAVSSESSNASKKKPEETTSDSSPSSWSSDSDQKKKKRKSKLKKKKKKKKWDCEGLLFGKSNNIFNEFDIPVPSDLIEMVPMPLPVPSPIIPIDKILPMTAPPLLINPILEKPPEEQGREEEVEEKPSEDGLDLTKPFVFSSIVLPTKKIPLVDNSNLKLDDDSDSTDFTDKFVKKPEPIEESKKEEETIETGAETIDEVKAFCEETIAKQSVMKGEAKQTVPVIDDIGSVPLPPEKTTPTPQLAPIKRFSRSISPRKSMERKEKRRSRSRSPLKRRSPIRRRELSPPLRRRHASPRRRSPPRRRGSPYRRSPSPNRRRSLSPRRRSPQRRRRRTPSLSPPPRLRGLTRKRTPSPRRRASPLNSPLDGFKRSVADSTISDDMLPQTTPDDYNDSPNSYVVGSKYFKSIKRSSLSPVMSPRRVSLDERISQVLGLEKEVPPPPPPKPQEVFQTFTPNYNTSFGQQYNQYGQYVQNVPTVFGTMMYTQPPPPIVKAPPPTKVLQVGNILQVVPAEEMLPAPVEMPPPPVVMPPPPMVENKTPERGQQIVQVGNMLQIVPVELPLTPKLAIVPEPPPPPPPQPVAKPIVVAMPVHAPEKQSAEALMKQKTAERKAEREKRRLERERRRKEKEKKRKEKEKKKQMKLKMKTENMIKRAIQIETEALANDELEEDGEDGDAPIQWPPVPIVISATPTGKGILSQGSSNNKQRKSVQFADGIRPGEGTSPSGGEELSSPPPRKLPKEKRFKKIKIPKKSKKKKVRVKVVKMQPVAEEEEEPDEDEDVMPPPSPPPGSPPPHVFPSRVKTHTINNVHQYVGNILQAAGGGFPFRPPMPPPMVMNMNRHQPPPGYMPQAYPQDVNLSHPSYQGIPSHH